jgi:hypothetical protein
VSYQLLLSVGLVSALLGSACFFGGGAQPTPAPPPAVVATSSPSAAPPPKPAASPSPSPTAAAAPAAKPTSTTEGELSRVWVGNTDGEGVYLRNSPAMADRAKAYPDGTVLIIVDVDVDGEGMKWHHVRAPDGQVGYVPVQYTVTTEP